MGPRRQKQLQPQLQLQPQHTQVSPATIHIQLMIYIQLMVYILLMVNVHQTGFLPGQKCPAGFADSFSCVEDTRLREKKGKGVRKRITSCRINNWSKTIIRGEGNKQAA